jgi:stalled ribosome rescue protein Dom34
VLPVCLDESRVSREASKGKVGILTGSRHKGRYRRGYPVAVLIGFEENRVVLWRVFSNVVKPDVVVNLAGKRKDELALYNFHESIVNALRLVLKEGVRSIVVVAPSKTNYAGDFFNHVRRHHAWLVQSRGPNTAVFGEIIGSAGQLHEVAELVKTKGFRKLIGETTSEEADRIVDALEKRLNDVEGGAVVLYSLEEVENLICSDWKSGSLKPEYLMLTDKYLAESRQKNRVHRLLQISKNKNVKTITINSETSAGRRLSQLGGLVCFTKLG